jgi:hypothetical protein
MKKDLNKQSKVIEFGRKGFYYKLDLYGTVPYRFKIDDHWLLLGYQHPARYPNGRRIEVLDWCAEHAPNAHITNDPGRAVLFKDEMVATMFKLTFVEGD